MRLCAFVVSLLLSLPVMGYELRKDAQGVAVKWGQRAVFVLDEAFVAKLKDARAAGAVQAAMDTLCAASPAIELTLASGHSEGLGYDPRQGAQNQNDIIGLEDWPYAASNLAATVVTLNVRTHEIIDADIAFNLEQWSFGVLDEADGAQGDASLNDLQNTITHELGHALGLMHNEDDLRAVMYPSAPPGETSKRHLSDDDRSGLLAVYGALEPEHAPATGCSSSSGSAQLGLAVGTLLLLSRRRWRRLGLASLAALPLVASAGEPGGRTPAVRDAVVVGEVSATTSSWAQPGLIVTDVQVAVKACDAPPCEGTVTYRVPGGRVGDLEQVVAHSPVPRRGDAVRMSWKRGRLTVVPFQLSRP